MTKSILAHCAAAALAVVIVIAGVDVASAKKGGHGKHKGHAHKAHVHKAHVGHNKVHWKHSYARHVPPGWSQGRKRGWGCVPGSYGCVPPGQRF